MKDNQVRQQARPKRNNYYANDNKKSYNKNNYQARGRRPMPRRKPSSVKIIPLGGLGQIGMNITAFECNNQILIVDCGLAFPDEDMLGIDLVIPDITYLKDNASKIRGLVITHGHEDHIGAIPYFEKELNVPIYATKLTMALIENKLKEHGILNNVERHVVTHGDKVKLGIFNVEFIKTNHSIADAAALAITTPAGVIVHTGDFKIDHTPLFGEAIDLARFAELGSKGVLALMADSTNVERQGYTPSEKNVGKRLDNLFAEHLKGRMIIATFASNVDRVQHIINSAHKYGRKVAVEGRSMVNIIATASELGYIKIPKNTLIETDQIKNYPDDQIVLITTGSQGETMAALSRMANSTHRKVSIVPSDTIIFSSSPIPGNASSINVVVNRLFRAGAKVLVNTAFNNLHTSGHASQEEQKLMLLLTKPKYFFPVHGEYRMLKIHAELSQEVGVPKENTFVLSNGDTILLNKGTARLGPRIHVDDIYVDGNDLSGLSTAVLRDRQILSEDGMVSVLIAMDSHEGKLLTKPVIISRGFVYMKDSFPMIREAENLVGQALSQLLAGKTTFGEIKNTTRDVLSQYFYRKTKRNPMIIPVIMNKK